MLTSFEEGPDIPGTAFESFLSSLTFFNGGSEILSSAALVTRALALRVVTMIY